MWALRDWTLEGGPASLRRGPHAIPNRRVNVWVEGVSHVTIPPILERLLLSAFSSPLADRHQPEWHLKRPINCDLWEIEHWTDVHVWWVDSVRESENRLVGRRVPWFRGLRRTAIFVHFVQYRRAPWVCGRRRPISAQRANRECPWGSVLRCDCGRTDWFGVHLSRWCVNPMRVEQSCLRGEMRMGVTRWWWQSVIRWVPMIQRMRR